MHPRRRAREEPAVGQRAVTRIEAVSPNRVPGRIRVVHHGAVRAPAEPVRNLHAIDAFRQHSSRLQAVQGAGTGCDRGVFHHRTDPEAAPWIYLAIVESQARGERARGNEPLDLSRRRVVQRDTLIEGDDQALAAANKSETRHAVWRVPGSQGARHRLEFEQLRALDVGPPGALPLLVPRDGFAEQVPDVDCMDELRCRYHQAAYSPASIRMTTSAARLKPPVVWVSMSL